MEPHQDIHTFHLDMANRIYDVELTVEQIHELMDGGIVYGDDGYGNEVELQASCIEAGDLGLVLARSDSIIEHDGTRYRIDLV